MKVLPLFLLFSMVLAAGCQQPAKRPATPPEDTLAAETDPAAQGPWCFLFVLKRDTISLEFRATTGDSVSGRLAYRFYEKDKSSGTIRGTLRNNIVDAQYQFMSEGMESIRQVVFRMEGEKLYEGRPDTFDQQGNPVFNKDATRIPFDTIPFIRQPCNE